MPNHVYNEIIIPDMDETIFSRIEAAVIGDGGGIDFAKLVPPPINIWMHSAGQDHEKTFPNTSLDWCRANWGTKWNAYGQPSISTDGDVVRMEFQTAWSPPMGWIVALYNTFGFSFKHSWLSEGHDAAFVDVWTRDTGELFCRQWERSEADDYEFRRLHQKLWGCLPEEMDE